MQRSLLRWGIIRRTLTRSIVTHGRQTVKHSAEVQRTLAAYPLFHLNDDGSNQHLGPRRGDEVILTLSGGVDSSVSAYLALQEGGLIPHRTIFMRNWNSLEESETFEPGSGGSQGCQWQRDWEKVLAMAKWLGVKAELVRSAMVLLFTFAHQNCDLPIADASPVSADGSIHSILEYRFLSLS